MSPLFMFSACREAVARRFLRQLVWLIAPAAVLSLAAPVGATDLAVDDQNPNGPNSPYSITSNQGPYDIIYAGAIHSGVINHSGGAVSASNLFVAYAGGSTGTYNLGNTGSLSLS